MEFAKLAVGALATIALYSILYRENKLYRFFEHVYIGLAVGFSVVVLWTENLEASWWNQMIGKAASAPGAGDGSPAMYLFGLLLPIGCMGFLVFSQKHSWMARIPIGIILGMWGGQQFNAFQTEMVPQVRNSMVQVIPSTFSSITIPNGVTLSPGVATEIATKVGVDENVVQAVASNIKRTPGQLVQLQTDTGASAEQIGAVTAEVQGVIGNETYTTEAINNVIYAFTLLSVLSYFLFGFEMKSAALQGFTRAGRLLLMVGFGAIFGSTVMTRFTLLIDRMSFVFIEFLKDGIPRMLGGG